jgi:hypothetical protein
MIIREPEIKLGAVRSHHGSPLPACGRPKQVLVSYSEIFARGTDTRARRFGRLASALLLQVR